MRRLVSLERVVGFGRERAAWLQFETEVEVCWMTVVGLVVGLKVVAKRVVVIEAD